MDEVDHEDLNDLEEHLYAQIHHKFNDLTSFETNSIKGDEQISALKSYKSLNRYWAMSDDRNAKFSSSIHNGKNNKADNIVSVTNDNKFNRVATFESIGNTQNHKKTTYKGYNNRFIVNNKSVEITSSNNNEGQKTSCDLMNLTGFDSNRNYQQGKFQKKFRQNQKDHQKLKEQKQKKIYNRENLRINPLAAILPSKFNKMKTLEKEKYGTMNAQILNRQPTKLQNNVVQDAKKNKAQKTLTKLSTWKGDLLTIIVDSEDDMKLNSQAGDDDVVEVPIQKSPVYTVEDSEDELAVISDAITTNSDEKRVNKLPISVDENRSRCNSPCSVQSTDDFIFKTDRRRLLETNVLADDEDLFVLTSNIDRSMTNSVSTHEGQIKQHTLLRNDTRIKDIFEELPANVQELDVLNVNELDMCNATVYSKGISKKETVIRCIISSSDDESDDVVEITKPEKKIYRNTSNSDQKSNIPYILCGPAIEHKRRNSKTDIPSNTRRTSVSHMSDNQFIATINTLAEGGNVENSCNYVAEGIEKSNFTKVCQNSDSEEEDLEHELEKVPTARHIAEDVLHYNYMQQKSDNENVRFKKIGTASVIDDQAALHGEISANFDKLFETIENFSNPKAPVVDVSDESDPEMTYPDDAFFTSNVEEHNYNNSTSNLNDPKDPIYNIVYYGEQIYNSGLGWNDEMRKFYNDSWGGENFNVEKICSQMDPNPNVWKINKDDRFPKTQQRSNLKCYNCCEFGHVRSKCNRPKKPPICYVCGEKGHYEPRCPNTICLRCGAKTKIFTKSCNACIYQNRIICPICKLRGHTQNQCPDKWRRYHSTTTKNSYPNSHVVYNERKWCCVCGGSGHFSDTCTDGLRMSQYHPIATYIQSHQKSYKDIPIKNIDDCIPFNLMYKPSETISFDLATNTNSKKYYGRFLKAVNLDYMLRRKRKVDIAEPDSTAVSTLKKKSKKNVNINNNNPCNKITPKLNENKYKYKVTTPDQVQEISESGKIESESEENLPMPDEERNNSQNGFIDNYNTIDQTHENVFSYTNECLTLEHKDNDCSENHFAGNDGHNYSQDMKRFMMFDEIYTDDYNGKFLEPSDLPLIHQFTNDGIKTPPPPIISPAGIDSDSNYSFSEHFGDSTIAKQNSLPDYIPFSFKEDDRIKSTQNETEIVKHYDSTEIDNDTFSCEEQQSETPFSNLPCEAKIYLTNFHSTYLLSASGNSFLMEKSRICDVKTRLDWTSVGYVLILFGTQKNQDRFHQELLLQYEKLTDETQQDSDNFTKLPKRVDVLIRFLRDNINQLTINLGNVNQLLKRLQALERNNSIRSTKSAEKVRRLLNMILKGQAGLSDGKIHLDKLLLNLKILINDYKPEDIVTQELREEIDKHNKYLFTSYRHGDYIELVKAYNCLVSKNRLTNLNIDPKLLGQKMLDTNLTISQRERFQQTEIPNNDSLVEGSNYVPNPLNPKYCKIKKINNSSRTFPQVLSSPKMEIDDKAFNSSTKNHSCNNFLNKKSCLRSPKNKSTIVCEQSNVRTKNNRRRQSGNFSFKKPEQNLMSYKNRSKKTNNESLKQLKQTPSYAQERGNTSTSSFSNTDPNKTRAGIMNIREPSAFWSNQSLKYINECIQLSTQEGQLLEKLYRIKEKTENGGLSYNDYRAVIQLHNTISQKI